MTPDSPRESGVRSAGVCSVCGKDAEKRYGGEGRWLVMCLDCWLILDSAPPHTTPSEEEE